MSQETSEEPLYTEIYRKNAAAQIGPRTRTHTLCEPAQSKCMSTSHKRHQKSHVIPEFTEKMPRPRMCPERGRTLMCEPAKSKRMSTCHKTSEKPRYTEIYRKNAAAQIGPRTQTNTLCEPGQSKRMSRCHKSQFIRKFTGKMLQTRVSTLIKHQPLHLP